MSKPLQHQGPHTPESIANLIERGYALYRSDQMTYLLKLAIAVELRKNPENGRRTIQQTLANIQKLADQGKKTKNDFEWEEILTTKSPEEIAEILESDSENSQRLRSNFRGTGIISEEKRKGIIHNYCHGIPITPAQVLS